MPRFRATVWVLTSMVAAVEGYAGLQRRIAEEEAEDEDQFKAIVQDYWLHDVDAEVTFGPVTQKS